MKKHVFTLLGIFLSLSALAQFGQGRMLVGGAFGLDINTNKDKFGGTTVTDSKSTSFSLEPRFGYFIIDNLALGAGLNLGATSFKDENSDYKSNDSEITFDPFVRYYLKPGVFFEGKFGVGSGKVKTENANGNVNDFKYGISKWALAVGYAAFINNNVAIEPMLGYGVTGRKNKDNDAKDIDQGLFIRVGFQVYLGK